MRTSCALATFTAFLIAIPVSADEWPHWRGPKRDGVWRESGIVTKFDKPALTPMWTADIGGGYSGPTVADGRVFVTDRLIKPKQVERVHCFDAHTGKKIWSHTYDCAYRGVGYDAGPRASVTIDGDRAYTLGAMGNLFCFDAATGKVHWQKDLNTEYKIRMPIWGIATAPLVENDLLIVHIGGEDNASVVAFDKKTGQEKWKALPDNASYVAPRIIEQAGQRVLLVWTGERVTGLDPKTGKLHWAIPFEQRRMVINIADPVRSGDHLFMTAFFDGAQLIKLDDNKLAATEVWRRMGDDEKNTEALHSIIATPWIKDGYVYGVDSYGELRCLELMTGNRVWESLDAVPKARWSTIHFTEHGDNVWLFNERGDLIISKLSPSGYEEISRTHIIAPTTGQLNRRGGVVWTHPAYAYKRIYIRNDEQLVCTDLSAK